MSDSSSLFRVLKEHEETKEAVEKNPKKPKKSLNENPFFARESEDNHPFSVLKLRQTGLVSAQKGLKETLISEVQDEKEVPKKMSVIKRKSMVELEKSGFKKSGRHIINEFGQIVGNIPEIDPTPPQIIESQSEPSTESESEQPVPDQYNTIKQAQHFKSLPSQSPFHPNLRNDSLTTLSHEIESDLYRTEDHQVSRPSIPLPILNNNRSSTFTGQQVSNSSTIQKEKDQSRKKNQNSSQVNAWRKKFKIIYHKKDLDKVGNNVPDDFQLIVRGRRVKEDRVWNRQWLELDRLRKYIKEALDKNDQLGVYMLHGEKGRSRNESSVPM